MQEDNDVIQKGVKFFCDTTQFTSLQFFGPHENPHGVRVLRNNYHIRPDSKLVHNTCEMRPITCACSMCTSMSYTP